MTNPRVGFVGLGLMGMPMAKNLIKAGIDLAVYNRTRSKTLPLVEMGAKSVETPAEIAKLVDIVLVIVSDAADVEEVVLGPDGIVEGARDGLIVVDMTTDSPLTAKKLHEELHQRGVRFLDAPVSGGVSGAEAGTLSIMVGADRDDFMVCEPVFCILGTSVVHMGPVGAGQTVKLCNQVACALSLVAMSECLILASKSGLDMDLMLKVVQGGAAGSWTFDNLAAKAIRRDFSPGFMVRLQQKDLRHALNLATANEVSLPGTALVSQLLAATEALGSGDEGTQALYKAYLLLSNQLAHD